MRNVPIRAELEERNFRGCSFFKYPLLKVQKMAKGIHSVILMSVIPIGNVLLRWITVILEAI